jgi:hypothetical protein
MDVVVIFRDPATGFRGDLNVNDRLGVCNSQLIKQYRMRQPLLRPVIALIKLWAKLSCLNDASGRKHGDGQYTFSSYSLVLMTIARFQVSTQKRLLDRHLKFVAQMNDLLPNLQSGLEPFPANPSFSQTPKGGVWIKRDHQFMLCDSRWKRQENEPESMEVSENLVLLTLMDWFKYVTPLIFLIFRLTLAVATGQTFITIRKR